MSALIERISVVTRTLAVAAFAAAAFASPSEASSVCARLQAALNSSRETIGSTAETRAYAKAISRQQDEIRKVRSDLRQYGCSSGSIIVFGGRNAGACNTLSDALERMHSNLAALQDHKVSISSTSLSRTDRQHILDALDANGCNDAPDGREEATIAPAVKASYSSNDTIETAKAEITPPPPQNEALRNDAIQDTPVQNDALRDIGPPSSLTGSLQTVCVRMCDGGFFPLSSNVSTASFTRDAKICSAMCPGTETQLFYHDLGTQEMTDMISTADGSPYKDQNYAFKFRSISAPRQKSCGCNFTAYYRSMMQQEASKPTEARKTPQYSSVVNVDRETKPTDAPAAARMSKIDPQISATQIAPAATRNYDPASSHVRKVGPTFLPPQDTAIELHKPKPADAQSPAGSTN